MPRGIRQQRASGAYVLPVRSIERGGAITLNDGSVVRMLRVTPLPAAARLELDGPLLAELTAIADELAPGEALQWYVDSRPVTRSSAPGGSQRYDHDTAREEAMLAAQGTIRSASQRSVHLILRQPRRGRGPAILRSLTKLDGVRARLAAVGVTSEPLDGPAVSGVLLTRLFSAASLEPHRSLDSIGTLTPSTDGGSEADAVRQLRERMRLADPSFADERIVRIAGGLEQTLHLASLPARRSPDWLAPIVSATAVGIVTCLIEARSDGELVVGVHVAVREPGPRADPVALATAADAIVRESDARTAAALDRSEFVQQALWPATLPLALPNVGVSHPADPPLAASAAPLTSEMCGSATGIPFATSTDGALLRLDPWDPMHRLPGVAIVGADPAGAATTMLTRLAQHRAHVVALDFEGGLALPGIGARELHPRSVGELLQAKTDSGVVIITAPTDTDPVALSGAAAALLPRGESTPPGAAPARAALVILGADRVVAASGGARWLRHAVARAAQDNACVIAVMSAPATLDDDLLATLPVRILLAQEDGDAAQRLGLTAAEAEQLRALDADTAFWLNGEHGRARVRLAPVTDLAVAA